MHIAEFMEHHLDLFFEIHGTVVAANRNIHENALLLILHNILFHFSIDH